MILCKNCENEVSAAYCPACGQAATVARITNRELFRDALTKVLPWDKGFLYTTRRLLTRPGAMVTDYLDGRRIKYSKPLNYLLLCVALSLLLFPRKRFAEQMQQGLSNGLGPTETAAKQKTAQLSQDLMNIMMNNMSLISLFMIPFLSLCSYWIFRKYKKNYAEHTVMNSFLMAGSVIASSPFYSALWFDNHNWIVQFLTVMLFAVHILYIAYGYSQIFPARRRWTIFLKGVLTYALGYFIYLIIFSVLVGIAVAVYIKKFT